MNSTQNVVSMTLPADVGPVPSLVVVSQNASNAWIELLSPGQSFIPCYESVKKVHLAVSAHGQKSLGVLNSFLFLEMSE